MSYAGTSTRTRTSTSGRTAGDAFAAPDGRDPADLEPLPYRSDWSRVAAFAAGILVGALAGASTALLTAPRSGWETRDRLSRGARRAQLRAADAFDDWGYDVRRQARRTGRRARHAFRGDR